MTAPDRPTREQVNAVPHKAAALLVAAARPDATLRTAARQVQDALIALDDEVRALRAELASSDFALKGWLDAAGAQSEEIERLGKELRTARAALAARTPQSSRDDEVAAWIKRHRDEYSGPGSVAWHALDDVLDDYRLHADTGTRLSEVAHEGGYADVSAPLPAVPDGEDEPASPCRESEGMTGIDCAAGEAGHDLPHRGWWCAEGDMGGEFAVFIEWPVPDRPDMSRPFTGPDAAAEDGEDVPARLDAAAEVLSKLVPLSCAGGDLGRIAVALRLMPAEVRAAVASALARPTGGEQRG